MIEGLEGLKRRVRKAKSQDCWVEIDGEDLGRIAEWLLELEDRIEELERKR